MRSPGICWLATVVLAAVICLGMAGCAEEAASNEAAASRVPSTDSTEQPSCTASAFGLYGRFVMERGWMTTTVNGVQIDSMLSVGRTSYRISKDPQPLLVGVNNEVRVRIYPVHRRARIDEITFAPDRFSGQVYLNKGSDPPRHDLGALYRAWRSEALAAWDRSGWGAADAQVMDSLRAAGVEGRLAPSQLPGYERMRDWIEAHPMEVVWRFDNRCGPRYPVIEDTTRLVDFAMDVKHAVVDQDWNRLYRVTEEPDKYSNGSSRDSVARTRFSRVMDDQWQSTDMSFSREDVVVEPLGNGRLWEIKIQRDQTRPLFYKPESEYGEWRAKRFFVADVDGKIKKVHAMRITNLDR